MQSKIFKVPTLYGDHHVLEVRRILLDTAGVQDVYASSAFQIIEVLYDEKVTNDTELTKKLDEAGYLGDWTVPVEIGAKGPAENGEKPYFRHTEVYETTRQVVSFTQNVSYSGRPLWPCPGIGVIKKVED